MKNPIDVLIDLKDKITATKTPDEWEAALNSDADGRALLDTPFSEILKTVTFRDLIRFVDAFNK